MECSPSHSVTIVDDDSGICEIIEKMLSSWNFIPYVLPEPFSLTELLKNSVSTDIFLLDVCLPTEMTLDWIPTIMDNFPETKVIIMTGYADTDTVIKAIRNGAFDFLQKPLSFELMNHSLLRAIQLQERDRQMKQMLADLRHNHALLLDQKQKLEFMNERLLDTNRAFSTLAQNLDFERTEILNRITQKIESGVIPALAKIRSDTRLAQYSIEIDVIINMIQDIVFDSCPIDLLSATLTTAEARVASLIKRGLTSDMIAEHLFVSVDTVKTHRRNIRKKLNITNCQDSLRDFLLKKPMSATS
ncbi:MAG: response regulator [Deltaproteobacteria bacterium]|nr:response regulator [Deltaproteobacteria bacterium]